MTSRVPMTGGKYCVPSRASNRLLSAVAQGRQHDTVGISGHSGLELPKGRTWRARGRVPGWVISKTVSLLLRLTEAKGQ